VCLANIVTSLKRETEDKNENPTLDVKALSKPVPLHVAFSKSIFSPHSYTSADPDRGTLADNSAVGRGIPVCILSEAGYSEQPRRVTYKKKGGPAVSGETTQERANKVRGVF
jgi:hypothetical protein